MVGGRCNCTPIVVFPTLHDLGTAALLLLSCASVGGTWCVHDDHEEADGSKSRIICASTTFDARVLCV